MGVWTNGWVGGVSGLLIGWVTDALGCVDGVTGWVNGLVGLGWSMGDCEGR